MSLRRTGSDSRWWRRGKLLQEHFALFVALFFTYTACVCLYYAIPRWTAVPTAWRLVEPPASPEAGLTVTVTCPNLQRVVYECAERVGQEAALCSSGADTTSTPLERGK